MGNLLPKEWRLISDLKGNAFMNMAIDEAIAISSSKPKSTIRFYTWKKPAVSIGYFQRIMPVINWLNHNPPLPPFRKGGKWGSADIVRRPTGGGVVLHGADLTYSVIVKTLSSTRNLIPLFYTHMGCGIIEGLRLLGITAKFPPKPELHAPNIENSFLCEETPVESDVLVKGMKVAGCAARKFGETVLLQGYISIGHITDVTIRQLIDAMIKGFTLSLDIGLVHGKLTDGEVAFAEELNSKKYSRNEWNYKR